MKAQMTETELITEVGKFYDRSLYLEKALNLFEFEYGYKPEIIKPQHIVNQEFIDSQNYPESITVEALTYMKELQESGVVNMFSSGRHIQQALMVDRHEAREILGVYMKDYTNIYYPEETL